MLKYNMFENEATARGYVPKCDNDGKYYIKTKNNVKAELVQNKNGIRYVGGFGLKDPNLSTLSIELQSLGFYNLGYQSTQCHHYASKSNVLDGFWEMVTAIENIDSIVAKHVYSKKFPTWDRDSDIFLKIAKRYKNAIDNEDVRLLENHRMMLEADDMDKLIIKGRSSKESDYREHVVPCIMLHNHIIDMLYPPPNGKLYTVEQVAKVIEDNLAIVLITKKEAKKLDVDLGLRTTMPEGWKFGDSIYSRLDEAKIEYSLML